MKELMEREPTEESIVFGRMASLNFALEKLFDLKGISYKITQGQNITVLHNAMDAIEQDPENFFECDQAIKCSYGNSKAAMGQLVKHLIDHTRISHHEVTSRYVDVPGIEDMKTTVTRFLYLVEIETEHICNISIPILKYLYISSNLNILLI